MGGLLILGAIGLWAFLILPWIVKKILLLLPSSWDIRKSIAAAVVFLILFPMPLIDEIIGGYQFKKMCEKNNLHILIPENKKERVVYWRDEPQIEINNVWLKMTDGLRRYIDVSTGEIVAESHFLKSEGGRVFPGFDSGHDPLIFHGKCEISISRVYETLESMNVKVITQ